MDAGHDGTAAREAAATRCTATRATGSKYFKVEIAIAITAPSPIDVVFAILITVTDKTVTAIRIATAHDDGNLIGKVGIDSIGPLRSGNACTIDEFLVFGIAEIIGHSIDDVGDISARGRAVLHLYTVTYILHEASHCVVVGVVSGVVLQLHL